MNIYLNILKKKNETYVKYNYNLNLLKKKYIIKLYKCYGQNS